MKDRRIKANFVDDRGAIAMPARALDHQIEIRRRMAKDASPLLLHDLERHAGPGQFGEKGVALGR